MTTTNPTTTNASEEFAALTARWYQHVGLDTEGRAHFYDPDAHRVLVTATDRRYEGVDRDDHVVETIRFGENQDVDDYVAYVDEEADVAWVECDWDPTVTLGDD